MTVWWVVIGALAVTMAALQVRYLLWFRGSRLINAAAAAGGIEPDEIVEGEPLVPVRTGGLFVGRRAALLDLTDMESPRLRDGDRVLELPAWGSRQWRILRSSGTIQMIVALKNQSTKRCEFDIPQAMEPWLPALPKDALSDLRDRAPWRRI